MHAESWAVDAPDFFRAQAGRAPGWEQEVFALLLAAVIPVAQPKVEMAIITARNAEMMETRRTGLVSWTRMWLKGQ
jgi:hypothetical protein